jgi:hypothetical protein
MRLAFGGSDKAVDGLEHDGLAVGREAFHLLLAAEHLQTRLVGAVEPALGVERLVGVDIESEERADGHLGRHAQMIAPRKIPSALSLRIVPLRIPRGLQRCYQT